MNEPCFSGAGLDRELGLANSLRRRHYPGSGPKATMWDMWLPGPALWPDTGTADVLRASWRDTLLTRHIDDDGYVSTHQHRGLADPHGWPFPFWSQAPDSGFGWHFSFQDTTEPPWRPADLSTLSGWATHGAAVGGIADAGWSVSLEGGEFTLTPPLPATPVEVAPFLQLWWSGRLEGEVRLEWTTDREPQWSALRSVPLAAPRDGQPQRDIVPMYDREGWSGTVTGLRLAGSGTGTLCLQALFSSFDTRHNINNTAYVLGCACFYRWTRDEEFLRDALPRMRQALAFAMGELGGAQHEHILTPWPGHDGRSGRVRGPDGTMTAVPGRGIGNNYWDLLPFGHADCYATSVYYAALIAMADIEEAMGLEAPWSPEALRRHAEAVKRTANDLFWNPATGRFVACVDADGVKHDYGFTFLNLEAIVHGLATDEHASEILAWVNGDRVVETDTSRGEDIYHWQFAPRATTLRNIDWYGWIWDAEQFAFGNQVQDGGAVLGFSYHDVMARLRVLGPDNAWQRLREILDWYDAVETAGGYRAYYDGTRDGILQGGGPPGGLGVDEEFFESALVPQVVIDGFLGLTPTAQGVHLAPALPTGCPGMTVTGLRLHDLVLTVTVRPTDIEVRVDGAVGDPSQARPVTITLDGTSAVLTPSVSVLTLSLVGREDSGSR